MPMIKGILVVGTFLLALACAEKDLNPGSISALPQNYKEEFKGYVTLSSGERCRAIKAFTDVRDEILESWMVQCDAQCKETYIVYDDERPADWQTFIAEATAALNDAPYSTNRERGDQPSRLFPFAPLSQPIKTANISSLTPTPV